MDLMGVQSLWNPIGLIPVVGAITPAAHGECDGAYFKWEVGSLFKTYPFIIHDPTSHHQPRYTLLSADFVTSIRLDDLTVTPSHTRIVKTARPSQHVADDSGQPKDSSSSCFHLEAASM
ncbi:hypothetical protein B0H10DRAFT_2201925 [Mycena sp. CBHHK59/15]|nr:hypothetical protein B0H10DRAFT_2201925 [Mycena sp. CBHHK59/15]